MQAVLWLLYVTIAKTAVTSEYLQVCKPELKESRKTHAKHSWEKILHYARIYNIDDMREAGFDKLINLSLLLPKCFHSSNFPHTPKQYPSGCWHNNPTLPHDIGESHQLFLEQTARDAEKHFLWPTWCKSPAWPPVLGLLCVSREYPIP